MIFDSTDPLSSRSRFASRPVVNLAIIGGGSVCFAAVFSWLWSLANPGSLLPMLIVGVSCMGSGYYIYTILENRPIFVKCEACDNLISSATPWVCGECKKLNSNTDEYPFIYKCQHCGAQPKAYRCHHDTCNKLIFLSIDRDPTNFAYRFASDVEVPKQPDQQIEDRKRADETKRKKRDEIELARLDQELQAVRKRLEAPKKKTPAELLQDEVEVSAGWESAANELKARNAEKFKDDKKKIARENKKVDDVIRRHLPDA